jgi:hypothetical protein
MLMKMDQSKTHSLLQNKVILRAYPRNKCTIEVITDKNIA